MLNTKICERCSQEKELTEFPYHPKTTDKLGRMCKDCKGKINNPWDRTRALRRAGHVYLVQASNGLCKIGVADNVVTRYRSLQAQSPIPLALLLAKHIEDASGIEVHLHAMFQEQHSHGEWFALTDDQIQQAKEIICQDQSQASVYQTSVNASLPS